MAKSKKKGGIVKQGQTKGGKYGMSPSKGKKGKSY